MKHQRRKRLALLLAVLMAAVCLCFPASAQDVLPENCVYLGDVDNSGTVDATDARLILQAAAQLRVLEGNAAKAADMDNDGTISATDARYALQVAAGLRALGTLHLDTGEVTYDESMPPHYTVSSKGMICPLQYSDVYISVGWNENGNHKGIDLCTRGATGNTYGKEIRAAADGIVASAEYHYSWGNNVYINHGSGLYTRYAHCSSIVVSQGQSVSRGQIIAYVGNTGSVPERPTPSNPHAGANLHFEVWVNGERVDPIPWLPVIG